MSKANELLDNCTTDLTRLAKLKLSLKEKLSELNQLDDELFDLVDKETRDEGIEQADAFKQGLYGAI